MQPSSAAERESPHSIPAHVPPELVVYSPLYARTTVTAMLEGLGFEHVEVR